MRSPMRLPRGVLPVALITLAGALPASAQQGMQAMQHAQPSVLGFSAGAQMTEVERQLAHLEGDERNLTAELEQRRPELAMTKRRVLARGRAYYRLVRAGLLPAGGGFDALVDHAAHVERTRRALERDVAAEGAIGKRITEIENRIAKLRADKVPLEVQREALHRARAALAEAEERRAAFSRAFETSVRPDSVAVYGADMGPAPDARAGFRSLKGRLPFPIAGRAEVNRVNRGSGPALELNAPSGTAVRSVAAGRVAFADRQDDYGLIVILDHGDHYYSLYGSLAGADVRVGDQVPSGARLGTVGSVDGRPPRLYFEMRHNASTLDPGPWLGL